MGMLAKYLQETFKQQCPIGWTCETEQRLLSAAFEQRMGYSSRVDVLFRRNDGKSSVWIELEISRADPVANHAKFLVAHSRDKQFCQDTFISMVSSHVTYGRANLAANMIFLMRKIGLQSFQTTLLPHYSPSQIKNLNSLPLHLLQQHPEIQPSNEVERVFTLLEPIAETKQRQLHFVGNLLEVMLNVQNWNEQIRQESNQDHWKKRVISYFVYDPSTHTFAPSKFCAYLILSTYPLQNRWEWADRWARIGYTSCQ